LHATWSKHTIRVNKEYYVISTKIKGRNVELIAEDDRLEELDNNMKCGWERMTEKGAQRE
jgi:hypothetical protein